MYNKVIINNRDERAKMSNSHSYKLFYNHDTCDLGTRFESLSLISSYKLIGTTGKFYDTNWIMIFRTPK